VGAGLRPARVARPPYSSPYPTVPVGTRHAVPAAASASNAPFANPSLRMQSRSQLAVILPALRHEGSEAKDPDVACLASCMRLTAPAPNAASHYVANMLNCFARNLGSITLMNRRILRPTIAILAIALAVPLSILSSATKPDVLPPAMQRELQRAPAALAKASPAPYYISYTAADMDASIIVGMSGSITVSNDVQRRQADVIMRVGAPALDNTHSRSRASGIMSTTLPLGDNPDAIGRVLWQLTDREYEQASAAFLKVKTNTAVQSEEEDKSPDFSQETSETHISDAHPTLSRDQKAWENRIRKISAGF